MTLDSGLKIADHRLVQRIGIMGGTFDPIHYGHLILAEQAREQLSLETVLFITAADPPHKGGKNITPVRHRHHMASLAVSGNDYFECSTIEIDRPGRSYTVDTLRQIKGLLGDDSDVYLLLGADEGAAFGDWRAPETIQELATVVVANRPGQRVETVLQSLPPEMAAKIVPVQMPGVDISSTDIRERAREGRSIRYLTPDAVVDYILAERIYGG